MGICSTTRKIYLKPEPTGRVEFKPVLIEGGLLDIKLEKLTGFSDEQAKFFKKSLPIISEIANSVEFKELVTHPKQVLEFTNGMSTTQLYEYFLTGKTVSGKIVDRTLNIRYNGYFTRRNTVGYVITGNGNDDINFNKKYFRFNNACIATIVGNFFHEDRHNAGFFHQKRGYSRYNVAYFYGDSAKILAELILSGHSLTPVRENPNSAGNILTDVHKYFYTGVSHD